MRLPVLLYIDIHSHNIRSSKQVKKVILDEEEETDEEEKDKKKRPVK